jgi:hypothetical protein
LGALLALLPIAVALPVEQAPTLRLVDSDPEEGGILTSGEPLYLRLRYRSDVPIHILLSGYYRGDVVPGFRQDVDQLFPAGDRAVTVWLSYPLGARIDQLRVRIWSQNKARLAEATFPFETKWVDGDASAERRTKAWVAELTPAQRQRMAETLTAADEPRGFDPFDLIFLCVPGYFLLQAALTYWTSGGWRKATLVPAVIIVPILAYTVLAFAAQSNLWPLLLLLSAPLACLYLVVLGVILLLARLTRAA